METRTEAQSRRSCSSARREEEEEEEEETSSSLSRQGQQRSVPLPSKTPTMPALALPPDEFLERFRETASDCLCNAYQAERSFQHSSNGTLTTSLAEDVTYIVSIQLEVLHDYVVSSCLLCSHAGDSLLAGAARTVLRNLWYKQIDFRDALVLAGDVESCCASSNDFFRLIDLPERILEGFRARYPHLSEDETAPPPDDDASDAPALPTRELADLTALYGSDAVYAAQMVHGFALDAFREESSIGVGDELFSPEWEEDLTNNEVAMRLVRTMEDCLGDVEGYLCNRLLYKKAVDAMVSASVAFYVRALLLRAEDVREARRRRREKTLGWELGEEPSAFAHPERALRRIDGDVRTLRSFFDGMAPGLPALKPVIEMKFSALTAIYECLCIAAGSSQVPDSLPDFVVVLHKLTGYTYDYTKLLVCDLWHLAAPEEDQAIALDAVESMEGNLNKLNFNITVAGSHYEWEDLSECARIPTLRLDVLLADLYGDDGRRKRRNQKASSWHVQPLMKSFPKLSAKQMADKLKHDFAPSRGDHILTDLSLSGPQHIVYGQRCNPVSNLKLHQMILPVHAAEVRCVSPGKGAKGKDGKISKGCSEERHCLAEF